MYPCKTPCNIGVQIGDYRSGDSITKDALIKAGEIKAEAGSFTILSYRITMDGAGFCCDVCEINNPGNKFIETAISLFRESRRGVFVSIDCITAKDSNGFIVGLKPAVYAIR